MRIMFQVVNPRGNPPKTPRGAFERTDEERADWMPRARYTATAAHWRSIQRAALYLTPAKR